MGDVTRFPYRREDYQRRNINKREVPCELSSRLVRVASFWRARSESDEDRYQLHVLFRDSDGRRERKLCSIWVTKIELLGALAEAERLERSGGKD